AVDGAAVQATATVTFGAYKPLHFLEPAAGRCGDVRLVGIGIRPELGDPDFVVLDPIDVGLAWPVPRGGDDKYTQGVTGIVAGSNRFTGAAVLATGGAVQATSGMVRYAGYAADAVRSRWPEVIATGSFGDAGRVQAWVVGPGSGTGTEARETLRDVLAAGGPVWVDELGTKMLADEVERLRGRAGETALVLTRLEREYERLPGPVGKGRAAAARRAAKRYDVVVLVKG